MKRSTAVRILISGSIGNFCSIFQIQRYVLLGDCSTIIVMPRFFSTVHKVGNAQISEAGEKYLKVGGLTGTVHFVMQVAILEFSREI